MQALAAYVMQHPADDVQQLQEQTLPLSGLCLAKPRQSSSHEAPEGGLPSLLASLRSRATPSMLCSPFVALSGKGDAFDRLAELLMCLQQRLQLHPNALPIMNDTDWRGMPLLLNAYVVDYFMHGQKRALARDNGILEGDVWQLLKSVTGILAAIANALRSCIDEDEDAADGNGAGAGGAAGGGASNEAVVSAFEALSAEFAERFRDINGPQAARR